MPDVARHAPVRKYQCNTLMNVKFLQFELIVELVLFVRHGQEGGGGGYRGGAGGGGASRVEGSRVSRNSFFFSPGVKI
jgi:hypothetical protein